MKERERTFIMVKPDAVQRGLVGNIIQRFEQKGFKLVALKMMQADEALLKEHYKDLVSKPFFPSLMSYMTSGPVVPMVWEGDGVVAAGRVILGADHHRHADFLRHRLKAGQIVNGNNLNFRM